MFLIVVKLAGLALTVACWWLASRSEGNSVLNMALIWGAPLFTFPVALVGRKALDAGPPSKKRAEWATVAVHYGIGIALGVGIFPAVGLVRTSPGIAVPVPRPVGLALFLVTGFATFLTVLNLAIRGFGAPFAAKLSSRLATDWMYAWTRNPMGLCSLAWFVSLGLWRQSLWFLVWLAVSVAPGWLYFVKVYEERELEIRFGPGYLDYKARTPMMWPRRPRAIMTPRLP
jgi:protein-S-isoprenylcysteine O-methyltransferase Ste14